jgi:hypothetical protein
VAQESPKVSIRRFANGEMRIACVPARQPILKSLWAPEPFQANDKAVVEREWNRICTLDGSRERQGSSQGKPGYGLLPGPTKFTAKGAQTLREFGAVVEVEYGLNVYFLTGTLPADSWQAIEAMASWSGYLIERFTQWCRDQASETMLAWVWERQKRGALHIHAIVGSHDNAGLLTVASGFKSAWCGWLTEVSSRSGIDMFYSERHQSDNRSYAQTRVMQAHTSAARYMAKYMGKDARTHDASGHRQVFPTRWWRVSKSAMDKINAQRKWYQIDNVSLAEATDLVAGLAGEAAKSASQVLTYSNAYDNRCSTHILYPMPCMSEAMLMDIQSALRNCLEIVPPKVPVASTAQVAELFEGRWLAG